MRLLANTAFISKTAQYRHIVTTDEHLCEGPTGFRLALSDLILDDLEGAKIKVILFDVKCVKNGNSYDVGPKGDCIYCPWTSLSMTLKGYRSRSQSFDSKYLENGVRYEVGPREHLHVDPRALDRHHQV